MQPDYPPSMKYAMRYSTMGFVPQYQSGFVDIPVIKSYVEQQERNTSTYPAPTGGRTNITNPETTSTTDTTASDYVVMYVFIAAGLVGLYWVLK